MNPFVIPMAIANACWGMVVTAIVFVTHVVDPKPTHGPHQQRVDLSREDIAAQLDAAGIHHNLPRKQ